MFVSRITELGNKSYTGSEDKAPKSLYIFHCSNAIESKMSGFKYLNKLQDKRVLVFGGTSGMGYAVTEALLEHGAQVTISGSKPEKLENAVRRLHSSYPDLKEGQISTRLCDLGSSDGLEARIREALHYASKGGEHKIDHIVFTAGDTVDVAGGITGTDIHVINRLMGVRVLAPVLIGKVVATSDYVNKSSATSFTFTSGTAHLRPRPTWPIMAMLSGALQGLSSGLAVELAPIRVNVVNPGFFETELVRGRPAEVLEMAKESSLTKRLGKPEDIAEAYLYFMKDASADGTAIISDNGKILSS
ncbi:short-chain dehydrogenase, putative [Talaromyces stipitatus ATCC 10500]|uniref:Short-chain dehydrogenase, putative n=1 Tax=Talaromyces stipitatus (strain ATCC 10500 / CBS 375.48 / QM 6759 / NRRL 1006) TaxID=441959 RepID=B8MTT7_TALSN|nr:short-chain dehydrogenase, putative [Talaromyces stipitatus ATCC 10500]EED12572.1 short-chain dehydrogenase, putative [Talaromyces stipitatus ATCC 10500]